MTSVCKYRVFLTERNYAIQQLFDNPGDAIILGTSYKCPFRIEWVEVDAIHQTPRAITHTWSPGDGLKALNPIIFLGVN